MAQSILTIIQVLSAVCIIGLVLLQRGKGADAGAGFGAGASGTVFGARGATTALSRATAVFAAIFMINSLCLTYLFQRDARTAPESLLDQVPVSTSAPAPAPAPIDANAVPVPSDAPAEPAPENP
jgi:preprotein translocase subunit SecG